MNIEKNYNHYFHSMKEEFFQNIISESRILNSFSNEENHEIIIILEVTHPIKYSITLEKPRVDFVESWIQRILGKPM